MLNVLDIPSTRALAIADGKGERCPEADFLA